MTRQFFLSFLFFLSFFIAYPENGSEFHFTVNSDNRILVFAEINNNMGYYIVDTGVPDIILFDPVHGLPETDAEYDSYWLMGETFTSKRYVTQKITIGGTIFNGDFYIIEVPEKLRHAFPQEIKGLINVLTLGTKALEISFSEHKIRLHDSVPAQYTENIPYLQTTFVCFIPLVMKDTEYFFRIDTGNSGDIHFPENVLTDIDSKNVYSVAVSKYNTETNYYGYYLFKNTEFTLFNHIYIDAICQTSILADKTLYGGIGMEILKNYDLVFDSVSKYLFYKPLWPDALYNMLFVQEFRTVGLLNAGYADNYLLVQELVVDSPAWKAGLRPDDKISKLNSYNCSGIPKDYLLRTLQSNSRIRIEFYDSENKRKTINVKPAILLKRFGRSQ